MTINLIQDIANPHNNVIIAELKRNPAVNVKIWYSADQDQGRYQWAQNISKQHIKAEIYGVSLNWRFLKYCLAHGEQKFFIVGWANANTRMLILLFFLTRRPFNYWTDRPGPLPADAKLYQKLARWLVYRILNHSKAKIFAVGRTTLDYFRKVKFCESRLINLSGFVADNFPEVYSHRGGIFAKYKTKSGQFLVGGRHV